MHPVRPDDLDRQLEFLAVLDRLKSVERRSTLTDGSRHENSAEHSWHVAMFAMALAPYAPEVDVARTIRLLLVHDIVEIDAGDCPLHAESRDAQAIAEAERRAAERLFGLLPPIQADAMLELWREFEAGESREARFAKAMDRLQPLLMNVRAGGGTWVDAQVTEAQVHARYGPAISAGSQALWARARELVRRHFETAANRS